MRPGRCPTSGPSDGAGERNSRTFSGLTHTPAFTSAASSGRSAVRNRRPQPPSSPSGLTVAPTHSSRPPRPARDRRAGPADRLRGPPTPTRGSPAAGDPTCRRARAGPPRARRAARAASRRFTPRAPLLPCLAAHHRRRRRARTSPHPHPHPSPNPRPHLEPHPHLGPHSRPHPNPHPNANPLLRAGPFAPPQPSPSPSPTSPPSPSP